MKGFGRVCPRGVRVGGESVSDRLRHERNQRTCCLSRGGLAGVKISFNARMGAKCFEDRLAKLVAEFGGVRGVFAGLGKILFNTPTLVITKSQHAVSLGVVVVLDGEGTLEMDDGHWVILVKEAFATGFKRCFSLAES